MKNLKKILFSLAAAVIVSFQALSASAEEFTKLDIGAGKTIMSYSDIDWGQYESGDYYVRLKGAYPIKKGEIYAIYGSKYFIGNIDETLPVSYKLYHEDGSSQSYQTNWRLGGFYATAYIENTMGEDGYVEVTDFGVPKGMLSDEVVSEVNMRRVNYVGEFNFDGFTAYAESSKYYGADKSYTLVIPDTVLLTEAELISNFYCVDSEIIIDNAFVAYWNYEQKPGHYSADIMACDRFGNETKYTLQIMVYEQAAPTIIGPDVYEISFSQIKDFSIDKLLSNYQGVYYNQSYTLYLDESDIEKLYSNLTYDNSFKITVKCQFPSSDIASKSITITVHDDVGPEIFVKKVVYLTESLANMTNDEIILMVEKALKAQGVNAYNIALADDVIIPTEAGDYKLNFTYEDEGSIKVGVLNLSVVGNDPSLVNKTLLDGTVITKSFTENELIKLIGDKLLNKGIAYSDLTITSDIKEIPSKAGTYSITFTYSSENKIEEGELTLVLNDETKETSINPLYFVVGGIVAVGLGILIVMKVKKRHHA